MEAKLITLEEAARVVPCDQQTLRQWLAQGYIQGHNSFGRRDKQISDASNVVKICVDSLVHHCAKVGIILQLPART